MLRKLSLIQSGHKLVTASNHVASIRKRNGKWQAQVRVRGSAAVSRSFLTKADAQTWARKLESEADRRGLPNGLKVLDSTTVGDLLVRYRNEMTCKKRGAVREGMAIRVLLRHPLAKVPLSAITVGQVAQYRDRRLAVVKPSTVCRELLLFQHALRIAQNVWDVPIRENPFALVEKPKVIDSRSRRLEAGEWDKLRKACQQSRNKQILPMVEFAIETAMRRSEILALTWSYIDTLQRILHIPVAKNGYSRTVPLTTMAISIINSQKLRASDSSCNVFPTTEGAFKMAWRRVMRRCQLHDFRYHDLRHEAVSRFFEMGLSIPEVALISGHKDYRMLARYTNLRPTDIAEKLARLASVQET